MGCVLCQAGDQSVNAGSLACAKMHRTKRSLISLMQMPSTPEEWSTIYEQYKQKSTDDIMAGCIACIDGFFQRCNRPAKKKLQR
jgi:hypothetical protein